MSRYPKREHIITVDCQTTVSNGYIAFILMKAFKGSIKYWCDEIVVEDCKKFGDTERHLVLLTGGKLLAYINEDLDDGVYILTAKRMTIGIKAMIKQFGLDALDLRKITDDMVDVCMQHALLGDKYFERGAKNVKIKQTNECNRHQSNYSA